MKSVFRKSALDKINSVDQLNKALKITSPVSWLALIGITLILAATVYWAFNGSLPSTITAKGVIVNSTTSTNTCISRQRGIVQAVIGQSERVGMGTPIVWINTEQSTEVIYSDQIGNVTEVLVEIGDSVENGTELIRVSPEVTAGQKHVAVCYVPIGDADKVSRKRKNGEDMEVSVTLSSADSSTYGNMVGRVINKDTAPTTNKGISAVVGNDNNWVSMLTNNGQAVCAVTCELLPDQNTPSRYYWSNEKGRKNVKELTPPEECTVRIIIENEKPISKLFAKLKDFWENR